MLSSLTPGQIIRCTILKEPLAEAPVDTIERLMRRDPAVVRGLRKSQKLRRRNTLVYNRGNRDWVQRRSVGKIVRVVKGNSWTCTFDLSVLADFKSVEKYLKIEAA